MSGAQPPSQAVPRFLSHHNERTPITAPAPLPALPCLSASLQATSTDRRTAVRTMLDLFGGVGGAAHGYRMAGWHVTGVDIAPQPRYAGHIFHQADALEFLAAHGHEFDAVHASP